MWSNPDMEKRPDLLQVGQVLTILPIDGVYHTIAVSDTLASIAEAYQVEPAAITECPFNFMPHDGVLVVGDKLIVPGGTKPYETQSVTAYSGPGAGRSVCFRYVLLACQWYPYARLLVWAPGD